MMPPARTLFSIPLYEREPEIDRDALVADIRAWRAECPEGEPRANAGKSWHSPLTAFRRPAFAALTRAAVDAATDVFRAERYAGGSRVRITEMWANVLDPGGWHRPHAHGGALWAGVYQVAGPRKAPALSFIRPYLPGDPISHAEPASPGRMLLFPGWVVHHVEPNPGPEPRISVSFNVERIVPGVVRKAPPFVCLPGLLDADDLTRIHARLAGARWEPGRIGGGSDGGVRDDAKRNNTVVFADGRRPEWHWLAEQIRHHAEIVNREAGFGADISGGPQSMQLARYQPGERYGEHTDGHPDPAHPSHARTLSVVITIREACAGGGTSFPRAQAPPPHQRPGDALFFRADEPHAALPVERGERMTLVVWFTRSAP